MRKALIILVVGLLSNTVVFGQGNADLLPVKKDYKWGYINTEGQIVIAPQYETEAFFDALGFATVMKGEKYGVIDRNNQEVVPFRFDGCHSLDTNNFAVKQGKLWGIYQRGKGIVLETAYEGLVALGDNYLAFQEGERFGVIHSSGRTILTARFDQIKLVKNHFVVSLNNKDGLYDINGLQLLHIKHNILDLPNDSTVLVTKNSKTALISTRGKLIVPAYFSRIEQLDAPIYKVRGLRFFGLWDSKQQELICDTAYANIDSISSRFYEGTYGFGQKDLISKKGAVIKIGYSNLEDLGDGYLGYFKGKWGILSEKGEIITEANYAQVSSVFNNIVVYRQNFKYGAYNVALKKNILDPIYNNIMIGVGALKAFKGQETFLLSLNENGTIAEISSFKNFRSLTIGGNANNFNATSMTSANPPRPIVPSQVSPLNPSDFGFKQYMGLYYHVNKKGRMVPPGYTTVDIIPGTNLARVTITKRPLAYAAVRRRPHYGLFDLEKGRLLIKPSFWNINIIDFENKQMVARAIAEGGRRCFISTKGKITYTSSVKVGKKYKSWYIGHIGTYREGYATLNLDGYYEKRREYDANQNNVVVKNARKWGYLDDRGNVAINPRFSSVENFRHGAAVVGVRTKYHKYNRFGVISPDEDTLIQFKYDHIDRLEGSNDSLFLSTLNAKKYGFVNEQGKIVTDPIYDDIQPFSHGFAAVKVGDKWAYINRKGEQICPPKFKVVSPFTEEYIARVRTRGKWGYMDTTGKMVIKEKYYFSGNFHDGMAYAKEKKAYGYIDRNGKWVISKKFSKARDFVNGYAAAKKNEKYGIINKAGKWTAAPKYYMVYSIDRDGIATVKKEKTGKFMMIDVHGKKLTNDDLASKIKLVNGTGVYKQKSRYGLLDSTGKKITAAKYVKCHPFSHGLAAVQIREKNTVRWGFIDRLDTLVIDPKYDWVKPFKEEYAVAELDGDWGFLDTNGTFRVVPNATYLSDFSGGIAAVRTRSGRRYLIDKYFNEIPHPQFEKIRSFENGIAVFESGDEFGILKADGQVIMKSKFTTMSNFKEGYAIYSLGKLHGIFHLNGMEMTETKYGYIDYLGDGLYEVHYGGKIGYLKKDGTWLWEPQS